MITSFSCLYIGFFGAPIHALTIACRSATMLTFSPFFGKRENSQHKLHNPKHFLTVLQLIHQGYLGVSCQALKVSAVEMFVFFLLLRHLLHLWHSKEQIQKDFLSIFT